MAASTCCRTWCRYLQVTTSFQTASRQSSVLAHIVRKCSSSSGEEGGSKRIMATGTPDTIRLSPQSQFTADSVSFDTYKFVKDLERAGFSTSQAESVMLTLREALASSFSSTLKDTPTLSHLELMTTDLMMKLHTTNTDIDTLKKTEVALVKKDSQEIKDDLKRLKGMFQDEMQRIKAGISLDFNLEKSRMRDETSQLSQGIKDTNNSLNTLVADMNTKIESQKLEMIKYLAGGIATLITLMLSVVMGMWRMGLASR